MNFLAPAAFAFAAAIPVVVLFYLLKRKRTVKLVSSTLPVQKFLAKRRPAHRSEAAQEWLLILQIILLILAVLSLSRHFSRPEPSRRSCA